MSAIPRGRSTPGRGRKEGGRQPRTIISTQHLTTTCVPHHLQLPSPLHSLASLLLRPYQSIISSIVLMVLRLKFYGLAGLPLNPGHNPRATAVIAYLYRVEQGLLLLKSTMTRCSPKASRCFAGMAQPSQKREQPLASSPIIALPLGFSLTRHCQYRTLTPVGSFTVLCFRSCWHYEHTFHNEPTVPTGKVPRRCAPAASAAFPLTRPPMSGPL